MGLIVQAPVDALLPATDQAAAAPGQASDESSSGDAFAGLLASLSESMNGTTGAVTDPGEIPVGDIAPSADEKKDDSNAFAALMAMTMPLTLSTPTLLTPQVEEAPEGIAAIGASGAGGGVAELAETGENETPAADDLAASEGSVTAVEPEMPQEALPMADVLPDAVAVATPSDSSATPAVTGPEATRLATEAEVTAKVGGVTTEETVEPAESPQLKTGQPPTEADGTQPEQTPSTSVVRSVGNAKDADAEGNTDRQDAHGERGRLRGIDRPQPRASAEGIAHAAPHSAAGELRQANDATPVDASAPVDQPVDVPELPQQVDQVARAVIERVETGGGEARIHLHPVELGEVTIRVHTDGDTVRVAIHAERREAMNILRDHTQDLSTLLGERGLNLSDVNVGFGRGNGSQTWADEQRQQNRPVAGAFASVMGIEKDAPIERHQRLRAAYNPDGAHFFRV
ncbi:MAG: flagellar hook-length control protein FliK [Dehalococcoidia bacterium]